MAADVSLCLCACLYVCECAPHVPSCPQHSPEVLASVEHLCNAPVNPNLLPYGLTRPEPLQRSVRRMVCAVKKIGAVVQADDGAQVAATAAGLLLARSAQGALQDAAQDQTLQDAEPERPQHPEQEGQRQVVHAEAEQEGAKMGYRRSARDTVSLALIVEVVERALRLPPGTAKQKVLRSEYPQVLKSNILSKWVAKYFKYKLWLMDKQMAKSLHGVPNWWVQEQGLNVPRKGRDTVAGMPRAVASLIDKAQAEHVMGATGATKRADAVQGHRVLKRTMREAMAEYNSAMEGVRETIELENQKAWAAFKTKLTAAEAEGQMSKKQLASHIRELKHAVRKKPRDFSHWKPTASTSCRFQRAYQNLSNRTNTSGNFLAYDDPRMQRARRQHADLVRDKKIPAGLILTLVAFC